MTRRCPKCKKWELDVTVPNDCPDKSLLTKEDFEDYFFRCWNCGFECSKEEVEKKKYPSEAIIISKEKK